MSYNYSYVAIYPNSTDDWLGSSPFTSYNLAPAEDAFVLGTLQDDDFTDVQKVPGLLKDIKSISNRIDPMSKVNKLNKDYSFHGLGGVAEIGNLEVTLINDKSELSDSLLLMGRKICLYMGNNDEMEDPDTATCHFTGYIYSIKPSKKHIVLLCRSRLQFNNWELGTVTEYENEVYKSKIIPICYGDFSDAEGYMPIAVTKNFLKIPQLVIDTEDLEEVDELYCWDDDCKIAFETKLSISDMVLTNNKTIDFVKVTNSYLLEDINTTDYDRIEVWNPPKCYFEFDEDSVTALGSSPMDEHDKSTTGDIYEISSTERYEFLEEVDGVYIFTAPDGVPTSSSGTLTNVSGNGPSTLIYTTCSSSVEDAEVNVEEVSSAESNIETATVNVKAKECIIKIDDEYMFVFDMVSSVGTNYAYEKSYMSVCRAYKNDSSAASHSDEDDIYVVDKQLDNLKFLVKHVFPVRSVSNFTFHGFTSHTYTWAHDYLQMRAHTYPTYSTPLSEWKNLFEKESSALGSGKRVVFSSITASQPYCLTFDLNFDKISIDGEIRKMFWYGYLNVASMASHGFGKGGKPIDYDDQIEINTSGFWDHETDAQTNPTDGLEDFPLHDYSDADKHLQIDNISDLNNTRYFIFLFGLSNSYYTRIANLGLYIHFYINPLKQEFWARGKGREVSGSAVENPVTILRNMWQKEITMTGVSMLYTDAETDRSSWKGTYLQYEKVEKYGKVLSDFCRQFGLVVYEDDGGDMVISSLDVPISASGLRSIDNDEIKLDGEDLTDYDESYTSTDDVITDIIANYKLRNTDGLYTGVKLASDVTGWSTYATEADKYLGIAIDKKVVLDANYIRDETTLETFILLLAKYYCKPLRKLRVTCTIDVADVSIAEWIVFTSATYVKGTTSKVYLVTKKTLQPPTRFKKPFVKLELLEFSL